MCKGGSFNKDGVLLTLMKPLASSLWYPTTHQARDPSLHLHHKMGAVPPVDGKGSPRDPTGTAADPFPDVDSALEVRP